MKVDELILALGQLNDLNEELSRTILEKDQIIESLSKLVLDEQDKTELMGKCAIAYKNQVDELTEIINDSLAILPTAPLTITLPKPRSVKPITVSNPLLNEEDGDFDDIPF